MTEELAQIVANLEALVASLAPIKEQAKQIADQIDAERARLNGIVAKSADEVARLRSLNDRLDALSKPAA